MGVFYIDAEAINIRRSARKLRVPKLLVACVRQLLRAMISLGQEENRPCQMN